MHPGLKTPGTSATHSVGVARSPTAAVDYGTPFVAEELGQIRTPVAMHDGQVGPHQQLDAVVEAWPHLNAAVRTAFAELVQASAEPTEE